jgi:hypothetical protein
VRGRRVFGLVIVGACPALLFGGCGGGSEQTHGEVKRSYEMSISAATFPAKQSVSKPAELRVKILNEAGRTVPNVAITVDAFSYVEKYPELAANKRPIWVVEQGPGAVPKLPVQSQAVSPPGGGQTVYVNTWALGPLKAKATQTYTWKVVPVKAGAHSVHLTVSAGLAGNATATLVRGGAVTRSFSTQIAPAPPSRHVDPRTGQVIPGTFPATP